MKIEKEYLGDGVYADYDGFHIILTTENGMETTNEILLDPRVCISLQNYIRIIEGI
jgi:hypothetical protein